MSGVPEDVLPEGWDALSRADAEALAPPEDAKERVRLRVAATLGLAAGLGAAAGAIASAKSADNPQIPTTLGIRRTTSSSLSNGWAWLTSGAQ